MNIIKLVWIRAKTTISHLRVKSARCTVKTFFFLRSLRNPEKIIPALLIFYIIVNTQFVLLDPPLTRAAGAPRLDGKTFFGLHLYLAGRCCNNPQSASGTAQCISGPGNYMVGRRLDVTIYCTIS